MVKQIGVQVKSNTAFKATGNEKKDKPADKDALLVNEKHPIATNMKNKADNFVKSFTTYPKKGLEGSKNANFYEYLSMGTVPYLVGSGTMIAVFNLASKFFDTPSMKEASKLGKKMGIGVALYGIAKTVSKKFIETPVKLKYGIDVNMPYQKVVYELPEKANKNISAPVKESHKVFESVDFPRWDLLYDNKKFGDNRNAYYDKIAKKMGLNTKEIEHSDQKVKPLIREKVVQTKLFSTLSSYLWAATAVGVAMQQPWENLKFSKNIIKDTGKAFVKSCKEFVTNENKAYATAGKALLGVAIGTTLIGNLCTLTNVYKDKGDKVSAASSLFDPKKEKVVC